MGRVGARWERFATVLHHHALDVHLTTTTDLLAVHLAHEESEALLYPQRTLSVAENAAVEKGTVKRPGLDAALPPSVEARRLARRAASVMMGRRDHRPSQEPS